jgi:hypothetical protein
MRTASTLVLLGLFAVVGRPAYAAPTTTAQCNAANQQSTKLRTAHSLRQSREQALICSAASCSLTVRTACRKRAADLLKAIPTIVFAANDGAGHELTDVTVSMDGQSLTDHLDGSALSLDPGQHTFTFQVGSQPPVDKPFLINEGEKSRHEAITLAPPPPPPPPPVVVATPAPGADTGTTGASRGPLRPVGLVLGGVGVAGLIAGGVMGGLAISKWNASQSACGSPSQCPDHAQSVSDHDSATSLATVSTVMFVAGGVALAAGATLYLVAPKRTSEGASQGAFLRVDPILGPGGGGVTLEGVY